MPWWRGRPLAVLALLCWSGLGWPAPALADDPAAWLDALRAGRAVALIRHASAPGTGDPAGFRLDDCATQRNLSEAGRSQARALGERLRARGIASAAVYSSPWCRCMETAALLGLGPPQPLPALGSFFGDRTRQSAQTADLIAFLRMQRAAGPLILVTHQVNIQALTGAGARSGEIVLVALPIAAEPEVLGRIPPLDS